MTTPDLQQQITAWQQQLWQQRVQVKEGALQQTHLLGEARRQIARAYTILRETK